MLDHVQFDTKRIYVIHIQVPVSRAFHFQIALDARGWLLVDDPKRRLGGEHQCSVEDDGGRRCRRWRRERGPHGTPHFFHAVPQTVYEGNVKRE